MGSENFAAQVYQDVADWKRVMANSISGGDADTLRKLAREKDIGGKPAGDFGEFVAEKAIALGLVEKVELFFDFLQFDPTLRLLRSIYGKKEMEELFQSKEAVRKVLEQLQIEGKIPQEFNFEIWWEEYPEPGMQW